MGRDGGGGGAVLLREDVRACPPPEDALLAGAFLLWPRLVLAPLLAVDVVFFVPPVFLAVVVGFFVTPERLEEEFIVCAMNETPYALSLNQTIMDNTPTAQQ